MEKLEEVMDPEEDFLETREVLAMLKDLRIDPNSPCRNLSLSQQKELLLLVARLFSPLVNLLLLDEPARNLEVMGLLRLRRQIESTNATVLMVSHDVDLINDVCTDIIDLHARRLYYYPGNYDSYRLMKEQRATHALQQSRAMDKKTDQLKSTLRNLKEQPVPRRKGGAKKKAKAIASHRKKMEWHQDSMKALDSSLEVLPERKGLTAAQRLKLAETIKEVPDKAVQFA
jgi:ATPase subunit of ABC transporter with duplicated ATPase domains